MGSNKTPRGLGKGLESLLGGTSAPLEIHRRPVEYVNKEIVTPSSDDVKGEENSADIKLIPVSAIQPNPFQPRQTFDEEALEELADSIRSLGLIQPISVRKNPSSNLYQIISGERRYRACQSIGMEQIPAYIISPTDDQKMMEMAIVENIQREDLDPIEIALGYQRLLTECNLTQEKMAERIGKKRASVANFLRLLKLPAKVQHDLKTGLISVGHAKVLLSVEDPFVQERLCDDTITKNWSVRDLEDKIHALTSKNASRRQAKINPGELTDSQRQLLTILGKHCDGEISLKRYAGGSAAMTVRFSSEAEVEKFLLALKTVNL
ncbi:MAG: ParB/RepB/Spo0J family partition protein [Bacteroidales bacterium]|nr:ParB/RepB/Spo0J family partition protein [Bacteroidales bacterium]